MFLLRNTLLRLNWMPAFLKQPWSNTRSMLCIIWENNLETFEKLFAMIQSHCSIYSHFLKPLHWNIHELWHEALIVMKIRRFRKNVKSSHFLHLTSINWLLLNVLRSDVEYSVQKGWNSRDDNLCKSDL